MRQRAKVLLGAGVAAIMVMGGWGAWGLRSPSKTTVTYRQGDRLVTETRARAARWLPPSEWRFGSWASTIPLGDSRFQTDGLDVGIICIEDSRLVTYLDRPE